MKKRVVKAEDTLEHTDETKGGNSECRTLQKGSGGTLNYLSILTSTQQTLGPEFFIDKTHSPTNRTKPFQDPHRTRHPVCHALLETARFASYINSGLHYHSKPVLTTLE